MANDYEIENRRWLVAMNIIFDRVSKVMSGKHDVKVLPMPTLTNYEGMDPSADGRPLAVTDGGAIYVNVTKLAYVFGLSYGQSTRNELLHGYRGLVYHELGHILFTPFGADRLNLFVKVVRDVTRTLQWPVTDSQKARTVVINIWSLLEEGREEYFLINKWPRMANYLRWLYVFEMRGEAYRIPPTREYAKRSRMLTSMLMLTWGRAYLPKAMRLRLLRDWCEAQHIPTRMTSMQSNPNLRAYLRAIKKFSRTPAFSMTDECGTGLKTLTTNDNADALTEVIVTLARLVGLKSWENLITLMSETPEEAVSKNNVDHFPTLVEKQDNKRDMSEDEGTDGDESGQVTEDELSGDGEGDGGDGKDGDDTKPGTDGDAESDADADGNGDANGVGQSNDESEDDGKKSSKGVGKGKGKRDSITNTSYESQLNDLFADLGDNQDIAAETEDLGRQVNAVFQSVGILLPPDRTWPHVLTPVTPEMVKTRRKLAEAFAPLTEQIDSYWEQQVDHGRLNVKHVVAGQHRSFDVFDHWVPDQADEASFEVVVACDLSSSMGQAGAEAVSKALWTIKKMCDDLGQPCTTMLYESAMAYGYEPDVKADDGHYRFYRSSGGTLPSTTIFNASVILSRSTRKHKLFVMMTDGEWFQQRKGNDAGPASKMLFDSMKVINECGAESYLAVFKAPLYKIKERDAQFYDFKNVTPITTLDSLVVMTSSFIRNRLRSVVYG